MNDQRPGTDKTLILRVGPPILVILGIVLIIRYRPDFLGEANALREFILTYETLAPLLYLALQASRPITFVPGQLLTSTGGFIFGPVWGTIWSVIGIALGAALGFLISNAVGARRLRRFMPRLVRNLAENGKWTGFRLILMLRLIPLMPFNVVTYSAPLSRVRFLPFVAATVIGHLPKIIFLVLAGYFVQTLAG